MKLYNSEKRENKSISGACVQAKIIRKEDKKIYLRIWNSGTEPAYNVNNCRILEPGRAFDEYAVADEKLSKGILVVTYWEDEYGCVYSMEQPEAAKNILKKICM